MFDFRESKIIVLRDSDRISEGNNAFLYEDLATKKKYVVKFLGETNKESEFYLLTEFKKLVLLSAEPEIGTVYGLVSVVMENDSRQFLGYLLDFINGQSLQEVIRKGDLAFQQYADILAQLAAGLEKAAYYEINHHDLHPGNIMIDVFGNVKLIDFLWNDFDNDAYKDLKDFKVVAAKLYEAIASVHKMSADIIYRYSQQIGTFRNASKTVQKLKDISSTLALLDEQGKYILAAVLSQIDERFKLGLKYIKSDITINPQFIVDLTEEEKHYIELEKSAPNTVKYTDTRKVKITNYLSSYLEPLFSQLKNAQLCYFEIYVYNKGQKFEGPYSATLEIDIFIELARWKEVHDSFYFLPVVTETEFLERLFSHEWIDELFMYNSLTKWPNMKV